MKTMPTVTDTARIPMAARQQPVEGGAQAQARQRPPPPEAEPRSAPVQAPEQAPPSEGGSIHVVA